MLLIVNKGGNTRSTAPAIVFNCGAHIEFHARHQFLRCLAEINLMIHVFLRYFSHVTCCLARFLTVLYFSSDTFKLGRPSMIKKKS